MIFIIGAGLSGLAIGYKLAFSGFKVRIYDFHVRGESSSAAVGMLAPLFEAKPYEDELFKFMLKSKRKWANFSNELIKISDLDIEFRENSSLMVANDNDILQKLHYKKSFFKRLGYEIEILNGEETKRMEPNLSPNVHGAIFCKNQDQVNPVILKKSLKLAFLKLGGEIVSKKIEKLFVKKNKVSILVNGLREKCEKIILSSGAWSGDILKKSFDISMPVMPIKGVTLTLKNVLKKKIINHNLWFEKIYVAPRNNGDLVVGATEDDKGFDTKINLSDVYFLSKNIKDSLPCVEDFELVDFKVGLRPATYDGLPIIGKIISLSENVIVSFGHYRHGVLLLPSTADLVYEIIKGGENETIFSPERFLMK